MQTYDILIEDGLIVDGSGGEPYLGNVAIQADKIVALGEVAGNGRPVLINALIGKTAFRKGSISM